MFCWSIFISLALECYDNYDYVKIDNKTLVHNEKKRETVKKKKKEKEKRGMGRAKDI